MKVRESGMPADEAYWSQFFDTENILQGLELTSHVGSVADLGCGFGTFSIPVAEIVTGNVHAFDIDGDMISLLRNKIKKLHIKNIRLHLRDFITRGTGLTDNSIDYVMLFNILHYEHPGEILYETKRILKQGGKAGIIHWRSDIPTPRGPSLEIRPTPEQCLKWSEEAGFKTVKELILEPYHFGLVIIK